MLADIMIQTAEKILDYTKMMQDLPLPPHQRDYIFNRKLELANVKVPELLLVCRPDIGRRLGVKVSGHINPTDDSMEIVYKSIGLEREKLKAKLNAHFCI